MLAGKNHKDYAKKLVSLSLDEAGRISDERVNAILQVLKEKPPRHLKLILKIYLYYIKQEIRRSEAVLDPPMHLGLGVVPLQHTQHRQCMDNIAQRTRLENEDF